MRYVIIFLALGVVVRLGFFYFFPLPFHNGQEVHFSSSLLEDPKILGNTQMFSLRFGNFWQSTLIQITTPSDHTYSYGETLDINGSVKRKVLKNKEIVMTIQNPQIEAKNSGFLPIFGALRAKIVDFCENNFSQPYSGLLVGIIFGIKSLLTDEVTRSFRITGLSHIVAASGMNVTLVAGFLITLLGSMVSRRLAIMISMTGIFLYVCVSGFEASIVRAAFMATAAFSAMLLGRQYSGIYILFLVGSGMLLWDPLLLLDVGFQLSLLATAGILVLKPRLFSNNFLGDDFGTTISAQLATLPILLATFGQYSLLSIIANLLVLWTIPLIMTIGGIGIMMGLVFQPLGKIIVGVCIPLLWYLQSVTNFFSNHAVLVQLQNVPIFFFAGYYFLLIAVILLTRKKLPIDRA